MGKPNVHQRFTLEEGFNGLWKMAERVTRMASSWKLLKELKSEGIAVREVESHAWTRSRNRMSKMGKDTSQMTKGQYNVMMKRDKKYIGRQMEIRVSQAKEDWLDCKQE